MRAAGAFLMVLVAAIFLSNCAPKPRTPAEILAQGAEAWNAWRDKHPDEAPDLSGVVLKGAGLESANLQGLILAGADFSGARLAGANLKGANLSRANLGRADLARADLSGANLESAQLKEAVLRESRMSGATLVRADVTGATLALADMSNATLEGLVHWETVSDYQGTNIYRVILAPAGFKEHALGHGARKEG